MGKHATRTAGQPWWTLRGTEQTFLQDLRRSGFRSDDDLDRLVGLDTADPLFDAPALLAMREQFGLSAEDIAELLAVGWLNTDDHGIDVNSLLFVIDAGRPEGKHRAGDCN